MVTIDLFGTKVNILGLIEREYADGNFAVMAKLEYPDGESEELAMSCNLPEHAHKLNKGEFFLKDWSENKPFATELLDLDYIEPTGMAQPTGYVTALICKISDRGKEFFILQ